MKHRTMKKLLTVVLAAATMATALPVNLTRAQAASGKLSAASTLDQLGIIDQAKEEDLTNDLEDTPEKISLFSATNGDIVIAIDPGHGGNDSGASYGNIKEKDVNLKIATYIKTYLSEYSDVQVYLTRSTDTPIDLSDRVSNAVANGADVFISIHNNASSNAGTSGSMVFYPNSNYRPYLGTEGKDLATKILKNLTALGLKDLGVRTRNSEANNKYEDGSLADYYSVIRNAKRSGIPGLIVEHAFVSNAQDRANYLSTDDQLRKLALADVQGIVEYYGLTRKDGPKPTVKMTGYGANALELTWDQQENADGYYVYRSNQENGKYTQLADVKGAAACSYKDETVKVGVTYYYKVRAYGTAIPGGKGSYSVPCKGYTLNRSQFTEIKQLKNGSNRLTWEANPKAAGYTIYRSVDGGKYRQIARIDDPSTVTYKDFDVFPGETYSYRIRGIHVLNGAEGYGRVSTTVSTTFLNDVELEEVIARENGTIKLRWTKEKNADYYAVQRSTREDGGYKTIATLTDTTKASYIDKTAERGMTYYYRVGAFHDSGVVCGTAGYSLTLSVQNFGTPQISSLSISQTKPGINISWTAVPGADGYCVYRSLTQSGGYTNVGTVRGGSTLTFLDTGATQAGTTYYYMVRAYVANSAGTSWSPCSAVADGMAGYTIMGSSNTTAKKMAAFFKARGGVYPSEIYTTYGAPTLLDFCKIVVSEAKAEGVRAEVVFGQICKETGFLRFGGDVKPTQCNFAGIGATGGVPGASFPDVRTGIRAQVQHLKAYASDQPLNNACVDPRFTYVKRCAAVYVEWLGVHENPTGSGWATGWNYGYSLRDDYIVPLLGY